MTTKTLSIALVAVCGVSVALAEADLSKAGDTIKLKNVDCDMVHKVESVPQASATELKALAKKSQPTGTRLNGSIKASATRAASRIETQDVATVADIARKANAKGQRGNGSIMRTRMGSDMKEGKDGSPIETPIGFVKTKEPGF